MSIGRNYRAKRVIAGASAAALAAVTLMPTNSYAEPSIGQVEKRLDTLYHQAEQAQERLNELTSEMKDKRQRLNVMQSDLRKQRSSFKRISDQVAGMIAAEAQGDDAQLSATQELIFSDDPDEFLANIAAQEALSDHQGTVLARLTSEAQKLDLRRQQVKDELAQIADSQKQAAKEESTVDAKVADAEGVLDELEAERRAALAARQESPEASRSAPRPAPSPAASGSAGVAVDYAMAQVGDAYVYGAAGPDSWDCSGLTMVAWGQAGVSLPHSSSGQMSYGTPVSQSALQPGDLVFYYQPVSHVGMYIGNGQIVHASNPSSPVSTDPVNSMPYSGAVRPG